MNQQSGITFLCVNSWIARGLRTKEAMVDDASPVSHFPHQMFLSFINFEAVACDKVGAEARDRPQKRLLNHYVVIPRRTTDKTIKNKYNKWKSFNAQW